MGFEHRSSLLAEGRCTQNRLQLVPAPPGVLSSTGHANRRVALSRRFSVLAPSLARACLLRIVALSTASSSYLLRQGCSRTCRANPPLTCSGRPEPVMGES